jgi:3-phenylpropionate/trans-cinnamate dioxygenase ferredoxin reductase subunit
MAQHATIAIVGAGQAGATAASTLRRLGHAGRVMVFGREAHAPYERPPLSKAVLADAEHEHKIGVHPAAHYGEQTIELQTGRVVTRIDTAASALWLDDGAQLAFDHCLIATGGRARTLPALPPGTPGVHYLRTLDDARGLREAFRQTPDVLVIGGGFLGLETASTARSLGCAVTLVETAPRLLERAVPAVFSEWLARRAEAAGVTLRIGARIESMAANDNGATVLLQNGERLSAPLVVVAIGMTPDIELARNAGLALHAETGGIEVDALGRTSAPNIYAAGDCTSQFRPHFGKIMRMESWQNANEQARIAATAMLGQVPEAAALPWFWTDQFGGNIQMLGAFDPSLDYRVRGLASHEGESPKFMLLGTASGHLRHALAVNAGGDLRQLKPLIDKGLHCDLDALADSARPLRQTVKDTLAQNTISSF